MQGNKPQNQAGKGSCRSSIFLLHSKKDIQSHLEDTSAKEVVLLLSSVLHSSRVSRLKFSGRDGNGYCQAPKCLLPTARAMSSPSPFRGLNSPGLIALFTC